MAEAHHLSRGAHERLSSEHHDLTTRGRLEIAVKIEEARVLGDLSENGDYHAAKEEQGKMEGRIRQLEAILERAVIVDDISTDGTITHGCIIELRYEDDTSTETMLFGSIEERVEGHDVVSPGSPLGKALAGRQQGDTVNYEAPGGTQTVEIVSIRT